MFTQHKSFRLFEVMFVHEKVKTLLFMLTTRSTAQKKSGSRKFFTVVGGNCVNMQVTQSFIVAYKDSTKKKKKVSIWFRVLKCFLASGVVRMISHVGSSNGNQCAHKYRIIYIQTYEKRTNIIFFLCPTELDVNFTLL